MKKVNVSIKCFFLSFIFFFSVVSAAYVSTDKSEYDFEETVTIYGREFPRELELTIEIANPNNVKVRHIDVTSDVEGNFTTTYFIPAQNPSKGIIEGTYAVVAAIQGETPMTTFDVTSGVDITPPTFSGNQTNETEPGEPCEFTLIWNDNKALHPLGQYVFSTDNSGDWMNASPINFASTPQTVSTVKTLRNTEGLVQWKYYASDNASNWASSDTYEVNVATTVPCELHSVNINPECSDCEPGERIIVNASYSGDCPNPSYIQVNANDTGCYICDQDRDVCEEDICNMTGITVSCSDTPCSVGWTIPTVPPECQGKTVNATYSSLSSDYPCRAGSEKKDEVVPTGSFTFYTTTTTTPTTTSPNGNGNGNGGTTSTTTTTSVVTTTSPTTTSPQTTTILGDLTTTLPSEEGKGISTYWVILIIIIIAAVGVFVWFKFFRGSEEAEFEKLKEKWGRRKLY